MVAWGLTALGALLFNLFIGLFFGEMLNDHDRRGALIRELEATRAELERAHHEAGVREERERLAREIHDTLAQGFTSLLMLVQAAEATLDTDPATTRRAPGPGRPHRAGEPGRGQGPDRRRPDRRAPAGRGAAARGGADRRGAGDGDRGRHRRERRGR